MDGLGNDRSWSVQNGDISLFCGNAEAQRYLGEAPQILCRLHLTSGIYYAILYYYAIHQLTCDSLILIPWVMTGCTYYSMSCCYVCWLLLYAGGVV
jgi:hypothetical protein